MQTAFLGPAVYGTVVVARLEPTCWQRAGERSAVKRTTEAMVYSTWVFSVVLWWGSSPALAAKAQRGMLQPLFVRWLALFCSSNSEPVRQLVADC